MGNRCIIKPINSNIGVYLHWNGGIDSVTAFLAYCELKGYRDFGGDNADGYGISRLCQVIGNYFGGTLSLGISTNVSETYEKSAHYDNGIYVIDGWKIVKHIGGTNVHEGYDLREMLIDIDESQPVNEQLGKSYLMAEEIDAVVLEIGDKVYVYRPEWDHKPEIYTVKGFRHYNGYILDMPYVDMYDNHDGTINPNNFLTGKVRKVTGEE